jgi:calcium-dependent protein kinase
MYLMLTGRPPFNGSCDEEIAAKIMAYKYDDYLLRNTGVSESAVNLIAKMLEPNPEDRVTAEMAQEEKWF